MQSAQCILGYPKPNQFSLEEVNLHARVCKSTLKLEKNPIGKESIIESIKGDISITLIVLLVYNASICDVYIFKL